VNAFGPNEPYNLIDRSLYDCLSGDSKQIYNIDRLDTTYIKGNNNLIIKKDMVLGNVITDTIISQWVILSLVSIYILSMYFK
jgi:hypothetical protein